MNRYPMAVYGESIEITMVVNSEEEETDALKAGWQLLETLAKPVEVKPAKAGK